jgi:methyl-accepting chemotaxis protein
VNLTATILQGVDASAVDQLARIATAQTVIMIVALLFVLIAIGAAILSVNTMKTLGRTLRALEKVVDELAPHAEPLIDGVTRVAVDASAVSDAVRRKVNDFLDTVEDMNGKLRSATAVAEERVREFGTVLDVVQDEAQDLLLDAASTAKGVHEAARALRGERPRTRRLPAPPNEQPDDE